MNSDSFDISAIDFQQTTPFEQERSLFSVPQPSTLIYTRDSKKITDTDNIQTHCQPKTESLEQGSFLKALEKFRQQISYESQVFDIYHNTEEPKNALFYKSVMKRKTTDKYVFDFGKKSKLETANKKNINNLSKSKSKSVNSKSNSNFSKLIPKSKPQICQYYAGSTLMSPISTTRSEYKLTKSVHSTSKSKLNKLQSPRMKDSVKKAVIKSIRKGVTNKDT